MIGMRSLIALLALASCAHPPAPAESPSNRAEAAPVQAPRTPEWVGCLYNRAELGAQASQTVESWNDDIHAVLVLASIRRHGDEVDSFVAQLALAHEPAAGESIKLDGRLERIMRAVGADPMPAEIRHPHLVLADKDFDMQFVGAPPLYGVDDFEVHGGAVVGDRGRFDISLESSQETNLEGAPAHLAITVLHLTTLAQCSL
jgi:hypothetical protein